MRQDIGNKSGDIGSGGDRHLGVPVAANGHFPARDIEVDEPLTQWLAGRNWPTQSYIETTHGIQAISTNVPV